MNDVYLIWEAYQNSKSNIVYHVSRRKFDDVRDYSHFTKNIDAAKDIITTDKYEGKYNESNVYYIYKYEMKPDLNFVRMHDIHGIGVPQWGNFGRQNDWSKEITNSFTKFRETDDNFNKFVLDYVLNELRKQYEDPESSRLLEIVYNFLNKNSKYIKIPSSHKAWQPVKDYFVNQIDIRSKSTREQMNFYGTLEVLIESLQHLLISNVSNSDIAWVRIFKIWIFENPDNDIHDENSYIEPQSFRINLTKSYYDGVVYENEIEGGGDSYIIFHPKRDLKLISREIFKNGEASE